MTEKRAVPHNSRSRNSLGLIALEPRLMYDGAAATTVVKQNAEVTTGATPPPIATAATPVPVETAMLQASNPALDNGKHEIVFVDSSITNWQAIANDIQPGIEVVLFNGDGDGLKEIADYLSADKNVDAVHIVSHGTSGELVAGTDIVTDANLASYDADLAAISEALRPGGDIMLYGCNVAQGQIGMQFITDLSTLTGDVVAASTDATGSAAEGGNWTLEASTAPVVVDAISAPDFDGILSPLPNINETFTSENSCEFHDMDLSNRRLVGARSAVL